MSVANIFRVDPTNAGDWWSAPSLYFADLGAGRFDVLAPLPNLTGADVVVGGGGLIARTFHPSMAALSERRGDMRSLVAWGVGESEYVDRSGGLVAPYAGRLPAYMDTYDLIGVRDHGGASDTRAIWAPCASCLSTAFDRPGPVTRDVVVYEHKRIPIPIEGPARLTNDGGDLDEKIGFLASADIVVTNSYHGAYWATLLGRKVVAIPNMSKIYRLRHAPVVCDAAAWRRYAPMARSYPEALAECRAATFAFHARVADLHAGGGQR